jgi:hypothetical protein
MFSCWIVMDVTSTHGTFHCRKTHIPCGDQLMICGLYAQGNFVTGIVSRQNKFVCPIKRLSETERYNLLIVASVGVTVFLSCQLYVICCIIYFRLGI